MLKTAAMKQIFEDAVNNSRISISTLLERVISTAGINIAIYYADLQRQLNQKTAKHVLQSLLRWSFLIEPVLKKGGATKTNIRWAAELNGDVRYAAFDSCCDIFEHLALELQNNLPNTGTAGLLQLFAGNNLVAYELPLDYIDRKSNTLIHTLDNVQWVWDDFPLKVITLRQFLWDKNKHPFAQLFAQIYSRKISIKAYLTDRSQTGEYQSNREKRWEVHPLNVQFAFRRDCWSVEYTLIKQLCRFAGFPQDLLKLLKQSGFEIEETSDFARCPITQDVLDFLDFQDEIVNPIHGKSRFHVGHINPLKASNDDPLSGHTGANICWISADGNRIQGSLTVAEIRVILQRITQNYQALGLI
jgi:hypothetical protein